MNNKGIGFFAGIIVGMLLLAFGVYIFAPKVIPETPCVIDSNCEMQKVCCTWRCDSKNLDWWKCPKKLCEILNDSKPDSCECQNFKCKTVE